MSYYPLLSKRETPPRHKGDKGMETNETSPDKRNRIKELYTNTLHRKPKTIGELWFQYEDYMDRKEKRRKAKKSK